MGLEKMVNDEVAKSFELMKTLAEKDKEIQELKAILVPAATSVTERLAEYAHEAWSGWIKYMFEKCSVLEGGKGALIIPPWAVERWARQAGAPYGVLPEDEKDSDRQEARRMIAIFCKKQV